MNYRKLHNPLPLFLVITLLFVGGCTSQYSNQTPANNNVAQTTNNTIEITPGGFSPSTLTIKKGEVVIFINKSPQPSWPAAAVHPTHSTYDGTSLSAHCPDGKSFDACHGLQSDEVYSFTFDKVGTWLYHDHLNPSNTGKIVVE